MAYDPNMGYNQVGQQTQGQSSLGLLPQKCTTPDGMPGTWNGTQCIPDTGTTMPPPPGGGTGTQTPCTQPDGSPGVIAPSGNCVPADYQPDPRAGCEFSGGTWDEATQTCTPYTPPTNPWDGGGGTPCTQPNGQPGKVAPSGNCVPIDTVTHNPGKEGCEFGGGRWDEATQTCLERGENNCFPGEVFHPFAGCIPDTGQNYDDWGDSPTPPADYEPCTAPDGSEGWVTPSGNCMAIPTGALPPPPDGTDYPEPGDLPLEDSPDINDWAQDWMDRFGIDPFNVDPDNLDYEAIQPYIDAAWEEALRTIEPTEQFEDERFVQDLINKGIDPNSDAGNKAYAQYKRAQADRRNSARFQAMEFGRDTQKQMWDQAYGITELSNRIMPQLAKLAQEGHQFDMDLLLRGDKQTWDQIMDILGLERQDYYDWRDENRYMDAVIWALMGLGEVPDVNFGGSDLFNLIGAMR